MTSQHQKIDNSSINHSKVKQIEANGDVVSLQDSDNNKFINNTNNIFLPLSGKPESAVVDWEWGMMLLKDKQLDKIGDRLVAMECDQTLMDVSIKENRCWSDPSLLAADRMLRVDGGDCATLGANKTLIEIFDNKKRLLILGAPGLGKTTALLRLAQQLINRAISEPKTIIPVVFELSKWQNDQDIKDWLIEQLYDQYKYDRRSNVYEQWLKRQVLLPLMDGLDELGLEQQKKCTKKLNEFAEDYPRLVVCCGVNQFETAGIKLEGFRSTVCLQPLSDSQIQNYFVNISRPDLWVEIQNTPSLQAMLEQTTDSDPGLLRVPLFVKLVANVNIDPQQPISNKADLLDEYVNQQLSCKNRNSDRKAELGKSSWAYKTVNDEPDDEKTRSHLRWVAQNLQANNKPDFIIEHLQPSSINSESKHYYQQLFWLIFVLFSSMIVIVSLLIATSTHTIHQKMFDQLNIEKIHWGGFDPESCLLFVIFFGLSRLIIWLIRGREQTSWLISESYKTDKIEAVEGFQSPSKKNVFNPIRSDFLVKVFGAIVIILLIAWMCDVSFHMHRIFPFTLAVTILNCIIYGINLMKQELNLDNRDNPNQGILNSFYNYVKLTMIIIIAYSISVIFGSQLPSIFLPIALLLSFFVGGGKALLQHLSLRIVLWQSGLPWNFARFLKYCVERRLILRVGGSYRFLHGELRDHFAESN
jgi:DNA polymerase III delta prime subunit